jgi:phenylpropionate dioxygenase-like ring-hydroxylating dioxygenase large terminal subunit
MTEVRPVVPDSALAPFETPTWLRELWYFAVPSHALRPGAMLAKTMLGEPLLLARGSDGKVFALRDICPHRGIPLSCGRFDGREVECCYHGWRFDGSGTCTAIPSLVEDQDVDPTRIRVRRYPVAEAQGNVWVYFGAETDVLPPVPEAPGFGAADQRHVESMVFPGALDHAVVGLMDPAHGPYVHRAWWWRTKASIHAKAKAFAPATLGFKMVRHAPSKNSFAYKVLGGKPETEIEFRLPSVRIESISAGKHRFVGLTAVTPIDETSCEVNQVMYWTMPWLTWLRPVLRPFIRAFLKQDRDVVAMQQAGLRHDPRLMLIDDADTQAKWYFGLKREFARARAEGREFVNPVKARTLRWRS